MSPSVLSRAAAAAVLLTSTASAAFSLSGSNVAMYWGQGAYQGPLSTVCMDPSVDVVNIAFVNGFPNKVGDYPNTNFGNACGDAYYKHPTDSSQDKKLLSSCPSITEGIAACKRRGKKVLLSLGGGAPTSYYLPSQEVAKYFAEFLVGAFGPVTEAWTAKNGPRPFGNIAVDGFDLDLEADVWAVPNAGDISANYAYFVRQLKTIQSNLLISAAPQCEVPDPRLADAIKNAPFDMIFTQFYNTPKCSARTGVTQINQANTDFTFKSWAEWLQKNSNNKAVKLYLGLPASPAAAPSFPDHYLTPREANALANKWRNAFPSVFGGVMLWEAKYSQDNVIDCQTYSTWIRYALDGVFSSKEGKGCVATSSSVVPSSTKASSTIASSTPVKSSTPIKSSTPVASSTPIKSSTPVASSTPVKSSTPVASSTPVKSSTAIASSTPAKSSTPVASSTPIKSSSSSSVHVSSSAPASNTPSASSTPHASSSAGVSSSIYPTSSQAASSPVPAPSSIYSPSAPVAPSSSIYLPSSPAASSSVASSVHEPSSTYAPYPSGNSTYAPYPTGGHSAEPSVAYPAETSKTVYPHTSETLVYPSASSSCTSSTVAPSSIPGYPGYVAPSSSAPGYGASSVPNYPGYEYPSSTGKGAEYPPSVTSIPANDYPAYPASSTKTVITTTYVDSCETGVTTKTETITKTVCHKCQDDSVTSVYVCNKCGPSVVTYTITKPATPATNVPSMPTYPAGPAVPSYGAKKPQESAKPSTPSHDSYPPTYNVPKKQEAPASSTTVEIVYITKTPVPVVPVVEHKPVPYPTAPVHSTSAAYPIKPTGTGAAPSGTGVPSKPSTYAPPEQFTGAASRAGVGMAGFLAVVAGLLVL